MGRSVRWILAAGIVAVVVVVPLIHYKYVYQTEKRLRTVKPNRVYRSGQMTAEGFAEAVKELHLRTIINLQDDFPDPDIETSFLSGQSIKESELCSRLRVKFVAISPDLVSRREVGQRRPEAIEQFLAVMDDPSNYPVLIHCRAGLNRTGMMVALYRMEYDGWSRQHALQEALDNGFGRTTGTSANDYIKQYVLTYEPGKRQPEAIGKAPPHTALPNGAAEHAPAEQRESGDLAVLFVKYIDWLLVKAYFKAYTICLVSLLSLYVVVDLFTNLDEFTSKHEGLVAVVKHIAGYYGPHMVKYFDLLCEPIVLLAAMFTVAWMQRNNELLPLLSAGVSTRRVVLPVLVSASFMLSLTVVNVELFIPRLASQLVVEKSDPDGDKEIEAKGKYDHNGVQIDAERGLRKGLLVHPFNCIIPASIGRRQVAISAKEARYVPPGTEKHSGGWLLTEARPTTLDNWDKPEVLERLDPGKYFLHTEVDFDALTRTQKWFQHASTNRLYEELQRPDTQRVASMAVLFHMRLTRPILGLILVFMGLSVILTDQNRNVFISAGLCLVLCGVFFAAIFAAKYLGDNDIISPALAAWLPVLGFGPLAFVMFDAVHT